MKRKYNFDDDQLQFPFFNLLPELRLHVLSFLSIENLKTLRSANKWFQQLIDEKILIQILKIDMGMVPLLSRLTNAFSNFPNAEGAEITSAMMDEFIEYLPRNLKRLSILGSRSFTGKFYTLLTSLGENLSKLPSSLQKLVISCNYLNPEYLKDISHFTLQTLECYFTINLNYVPRTLKTLVLGYVSFHNLSDFQKLPDSLEVLNLRHSNYNKEFSERLNLPNSLKSLSVSDCSPFLTSVMLKSLPRQLTDLRIISASQIKDSDLMNLPSSLNYLLISESDHITGDCLHLLPRNLQDLHLPQCKKLFQNFGELPPNLKSLNISASGITNDQVSLIPRCVRFMNLSFTKVTDVGLPNLPPQLLTLTLAGCAISDNGIKFLPRTIRNLSLYSVKKITNKMIQFLPDSLKVLDLDSCNGIEVESASFLFEDMGIWVWYGTVEKKKLKKE